MPVRTMELSEGEQFVVWMLRSLEKPGAPAFAVHATLDHVTLLMPAAETGRPDDMVGRGHTLTEAYAGLKTLLQRPHPG